MLYISYFQVEAAFSKFDISGDNKLNYREFCDLINSREDGEWEGGEMWGDGEDLRILGL